MIDFPLMARELEAPEERHGQRITKLRRSGMVRLWRFRAPMLPRAFIRPEFQATHPNRIGFAPGLAFHRERPQLKRPVRPPCETIIDRLCFPCIRLDPDSESPRATRLGLRGSAGFRKCLRSGSRSQRRSLE